MTKLILKTEKRESFGRKVKRLRKAGLIPANIFGHKVDSHAVTVEAKEFLEVFKKAGETQLIDLNGKSVLISNIFQASKFNRKDYCKYSCRACWRVSS